MTHILPFVRHEQVDGTILLGFADDEFNTKDYLMLQRTLQPSKKDRSLGQDKIHVELSGRATYGEIVQVQLGRGYMLLRLDNDTAAHLGESDNAIIIEFDEKYDYKSLCDVLVLLVGEDRILTIADSSN